MEVLAIRRPAPTRPNVVVVKSVEVWRSGAREACCRPGDVEVWRCVAGVQMWRHRGMKLWSSGGRLQSCRRGGVEVWRSGASKACCGRGDVEEAQRYGAPELWRCAAGV